VTDSDSGPLAVAGVIARALETLGIRYSVGGSIASSMGGEPRSTLDVDVVTELSAGSIPQLVEALGQRFYVPLDALRRAVRDKSSANLIDNATSIKVDLFIAGGTQLDASLLDRRVLVTIGGRGETLYVHSPEDILLQKLRWFRLGGERSDRQWRDVLGLVQVQGPRLDVEYLRRWAEQLRVADLLEKALAPPLI
jgi:hypothetical protein